MRDKRLMMAAVMGLMAVGMPGVDSVRQQAPEPVEPPRTPKPNDRRKPHQGAREIARRKRQMERNATRKGKDQSRG